MTKYDVIIIGAGPAGLTAGLYCVRSGLKTAVISKNVGGTANSILSLENWPGFSGPGTKLMKQFYDQLNEYEEVEIIMDDVEKVSKKGEDFSIKTKKQTFDSKVVILATGTERKKLGIPGEAELTGKGVSYCVTCDAFFFKNKVVGVVGGSDCAATSALALADLAKKVYVFYRGEKLRCEKITTDRLDKRENVQIEYFAVPKKIIGKDKVEKLIVQEGKEEKEFEIEGLFVEIGGTSMIDFAKDLNLELDKDKRIIVDNEMKTSLEGVFACGDITDTELNQVVVASAEGAIAAKNAYDWVRGKE
jgi:thioredoxin reductase (NADPH)